MIAAERLTPCLVAHRDTLQRLGRVEQALNARFHNLAEPIRALILSVLSAEPLLFLGPPGTAKSRLLRAFCQSMGIGEKDGGYFEYLLTPFTEPGELFGHYDIASLHREGVLKRMDGGMLQHARVAFLDEIFHASSALLNAVLSILNERVFHDRGRSLAVPLECLFAASNTVPEEEALLAVMDRFLLRCRLESVPAEPNDLEALVDAGWSLTYRDPVLPVLEPDLMPKLAALRRQTHRELAPQPDAPGRQAFFGNLAYLIDLARQYGASAMSNRRIVKIVHLAVLHGLYRAALAEAAGEEGRALDPTPGREELLLLPRFCLDLPEPLVLEQMHRLPWPMP